VKAVNLKSKDWRMMSRMKCQNGIIKKTVFSSSKTHQKNNSYKPNGFEAVELSDSG
jgi:hypothetical protein